MAHVGRFLQLLGLVLPIVGLFRGFQTGDLMNELLLLGIGAACFFLGTGLSGGGIGSDGGGGGPG